MLLAPAACLLLCKQQSQLLTWVMPSCPPVPCLTDLTMVWAKVVVMQEVLRLGYHVHFSDVVSPAPTTACPSFCIPQRTSHSAQQCTVAMLLLMLVHNSVPHSAQNRTVAIAVVDGVACSWCCL